MNHATQQAVQRLIVSQTHGEAMIASIEPMGGGCINQTVCVTLVEGGCFFVKLNDHAPRDMFACEASGLEALGKAGVIRVPEVLGTGGQEASPVTPFLVMEKIPVLGRPPDASFFRTFGQQLAHLHRRTQQDRFGFEEDNYLGLTLQPNGWCDNWVTFWQTHRLGYQLKLTEQTGQATPELLRAGERLMGQLENLIGKPAEKACLLHGDLWRGNFLAGRDGQPVLIDPATYWGCREADLAMTELFGGFPQSFYEGYAEVWPLALGSERRMAVYKLYHLLNHLNLFGKGYYRQCLDLLGILTHAR